MYYLVLFIYQLIYIFFLPFVFIIYGIKSIFIKEERQRFLNRFGLSIRYDKGKSNKSVWIHCLSLGEVNSAKKFINILIKDAYTVYISTTTHTGFKTLKKYYGDRVLSFYTPYDFFPIINNIVKKISPKVFVLVEWDMWPITLNLINNHNIPLFMINGRLGDAQVNYKKLRWFFKRIFSLFKLIIAQSKVDADIFNSLSKKDNAIKGGNLKYDIEIIEPKSLNEIGLKVEASIKNSNILCAASTHFPEEEMILNVYKELSKKLNLKLILIPRRPETCNKIIDSCKKHNLKYDIRSKGIWKEDILIVDTIGELLSFYKISDVVIMGGSFDIKQQGHNIIEPASQKKAIVVGPYMGNFKSIFKEFKNNNALYLTSEDNLKDDLLKIFEDEELKTKLANNSYSLIDINSGESERNWKLIKNILEENSRFI